MTLQNATISLPTGGTLTVAGNLTFGNGSNGSDTYLYAPGDLINLTTGGAVAFSTTTSILPTGPLSSGTYTLFTYAAAWTRSNINDLQMASSFQSGTRQTYAFSATNGAVTLTVSGGWRRQSPVEHRRQWQLGRGYEQELVQPRHQRLGFLL